MDEDLVEHVQHCLEKVRSLASLEHPTSRDLLQLGYNLGRLSELTELGRESCWDAWKGPVASWNRIELDGAVERLVQLGENWIKGQQKS